MTRKTEAFSPYDSASRDEPGEPRQGAVREGQPQLRDHHQGRQRPRAQAALRVRRLTVANLSLDGESTE